MYEQPSHVTEDDGFSSWTENRLRAVASVVLNVMMQITFMFSAEDLKISRLPCLLHIEWLTVGHQHISKVMKGTFQDIHSRYYTFIPLRGTGNIVNMSQVGNGARPFTPLPAAMAHVIPFRNTSTLYRPVMTIYYSRMRFERYHFTT